MISVTLQWFPGCLPQPSPTPGVGSKAAPPAFVLVSRHQGVLRATQPSEIPLGLLQETKDTISLARG